MSSQMAARVLTNFRIKSRFLVRNPTQVPLSAWHRREFSSLSKNNGPPRSSPTGKPSQPSRFGSKFLIGGIAVGVAAMAVYTAGYGDRLTLREPQSSSHSPTTDAKSQDIQPSNDSGLHDSLHTTKEQSSSSGQDSESIIPNMDNSGDSSDNLVDLNPLEKPNESGGENESSAESRSPDLTPKDELPKYSSSDLSSEDANEGSTSFPGDDDASNRPREEFGPEQSAGADDVPNYAQPPQEEIEASVTEHIVSDKRPQDVESRVEEPQDSLAGAYHLRDKAENRYASSSDEQTSPEFIHHSHEKVPVGTGEEQSDAYISHDGKLMVDFLQAIHVAEQRQAELDARILAEEKRKIKERYEKELKDARARELMYAEEAAMLDEEIKKERAKAAAALKSLQDRAEETLKTELQQKEAEANLKLREVEELAKAEVTAAIAREKAAQIEKMAEANLNINALCMAFYARSEEARQSHSVHKLALGALALEDALSKGLPIQPDLDTLRMYLEGVDEDKLLDLTLASLPEEAGRHGTETVLQLNQKFDSLKGTLRHFSFIPPGGGGILAHSLARVASHLKVKEVAGSGDGIESIINKVDGFLAEGKLAEAADALENGVKGSEASEVVVDWVRQARNRAIVEQALTLLESYATSVSLT